MRIEACHAVCIDLTSRDAAAIGLEVAEDEFEDAIDGTFAAVAKLDFQPDRSACKAQVQSLGIRWQKFLAFG